MVELRNEVRTILESMVDEDTPLQKVIENVVTYGCVSGYVTDLIYYSQTEAFFDRHREAINTLAHELSNDIYGNPYELYKNFQYECSKNTLAWFGFEEMAREIGYQEGFEI
jgi:hypothetical protein